MTENRRGLFAWVQRKPKLAFWATLAVGLFVGIGIGAMTGVTQEHLDAAEGKAKREQVRADRAEARADDLDAERSALEDEVADGKERITGLRADVEKLSAKGELPAFDGMDADDVEAHELVEMYDWKVRRTSQVSDRSPGTVLSQSPGEGSELKAGRSITLVVAKKAPPKPKQWVTIKSFSGQGEKHTDEFTIPDGSRARLSYSFTGDTNAFMSLERPGGDEFDGELLFNEIGDYADTTRIYDSGTFYLDVGTGSWSVDVQVYKRPD